MLCFHFCLSVYESRVPFAPSSSTILRSFWPLIYSMGLSSSFFNGAKKKRRKRKLTAWHFMRAKCLIEFDLKFCFVFSLYFFDFIRFLFLFCTLYSDTCYENLQKKKTVNFYFEPRPVAIVAFLLVHCECDKKNENSFYWRN